MCQAKKLNEDCTKTSECQNAYLCWKGKCQDVFFSLPEGTNVAAEGDAFSSYYCKYGSSDANGKCIQVNATDAFDKTTGLTKCDLGQKCNYTDFDTKFTRDCSCGFNTDGNAYCPKGHNADEKNWKYYNDALKKVYNNKCHTESRFNCYLADESYVTDIKHYKHLTMQAHLFQNAPDCVERLLSSSYIQMSLGVLALLAMLLF
jgi:hypothetical protein